MGIKIDTSRPAPENCLSWDKCQQNDCPLEKKPNNYKNFPEDKLLFNYHKCRCTKKKRMEIAKAYNMKSLGLTLRELSNMRNSIRMKSLLFSTRENNPETQKNNDSDGGLE